jgi:hypothetical protein
MKIPLPKVVISVLLFFLLQATFAKSFLVGLTVKEINGLNQPWASFGGGDTIYLEAGKRSSIQFSNLSGSAERQLVIINKESLVEFYSGSLPYGISIRNCHYLKLAGTGSTKYIYGIKIASVVNEGAGVGISDRTDNIEMEHVEVTNTKGPGVLCKTNPDCNTNAKNFTAFKFVFHHNYIHNTGTEGFYIGSTAWGGEEIICDKVKKNILPPELINVKVYSNLVEHTGWDGIQISNSKNVLCYDNTVIYDSWKETEWQQSGIMIGGGTSGKFSGNIIEHGKGDAINCFGNEVEISDNTITLDNAGGKLAVYVSDKLCKDKAKIRIHENSIAASSLPLIKFTQVGRSSKCDVKNNKLTPQFSIEKYFVVELEETKN